jgi:hypothetical protein
MTVILVAVNPLPSILTAISLLEKHRIAKFEAHIYMLLLFVIMLSIIYKHASSSSTTPCKGMFEKTLNTICMREF